MIYAYLQASQDASIIPWMPIEEWKWQDLQLCNPDKFWQNKQFKKNTASGSRPCRPTIYDSFMPFVSLSISQNKILESWHEYFCKSLFLYHFYIYISLLIYIYIYFYPITSPLAHLAHCPSWGKISSSHRCSGTWLGMLSHRCVCGV